MPSLESLKVSINIYHELDTKPYPSPASSHLMEWGNCCVKS